jgi:hypothetical protein
MEQELNDEKGLAIEVVSPAFLNPQKMMGKNKLR